MDNDKLKIAEEIVSKILKNELESLRKRIFPYKRKKLLQKDVVICVEELKEFVSGAYTNTKHEEPYNYKHIIKVSYKQVVKSFDKDNDINAIRFNMDLVRGTIRHELIHAFCQEEFEDWDLVSGTVQDSSFIFLSILTWVCGNSNHDFVLRSWNGSDLERNARSYSNYEDLKFDLIRYIIKIQRVISDIKKEFDEKTTNQLESNKTKIYYPDLNINLGGSSEGISKYYHNKKRKIVFIEGLKKIVEFDQCIMEIGFIIPTDNLKNNILKKFYNDEFVISEIV